MQALTAQLYGKYRGVTIYGKGDAAHAAGVSGHNEDDTPGVKAELQDADTKKEHRAIDVMIGSAFTKAQADSLVAALLADPNARARLYYIIWNGHIWSRSHGWAKRKYNGKDQHTNHVHLSGWAADDDNTAAWPAVGSGGVVPMWCKHGDEGENVRRLQLRLRNLGYDLGKAGADSDYGDATAAALKKACLSVYSGYAGDGKAYEADEDIYLDVLMARKYGKDAPDLQPLLDRLSKLEKLVSALPTNPPLPAPGVPSRFTIKGGTIEVAPL